MADVYVRSGAGGAATGADWANAFLTLAAACAAKAAGDRFLVSEDHVENPSTVITINCPGIVTAPCQILCVNHAGSVPPVSADLRATASIGTTGANSLTLNGHFYCYGIIFSANLLAAVGGGAVNMTSTANNQQRFDSCIFRSLSTATGGNITTGASTAVYWNNCSVRFGNAGNQMALGRGRFDWRNSPGAIDVAGTIPTFLFSAFGGGVILAMEGVDLTNLSGKTIFNAVSAAGTLAIKDCKLPASITISAAQTGGIGQGDVFVDRCHASNNYMHERHNYAGDMTTDISIVRTGAASDGVVAVSHKIQTSANARWADPFTSEPLSIWNDTVGSAVTVTVYACITGAVSLPNKEDLWIDVEYLGTSGSPQGSFATSGNATIVDTAPNVTDASSWIGGTTTKFKMAVTVTPQVKGPITVYVRAGKASVNAYYIDPKPVLT
jgi:hypothetical protein